MYSTVRVLHTLALTRCYGVAVTSIRWKGVENVDDGELEPAEGRSTDTRKALQKPVGLVDLVRAISLSLAPW